MIYSRQSPLPTNKGGGVSLESFGRRFEPALAREPNAIRMSRSRASNFIYILNYCHYVLKTLLCPYGSVESSTYQWIGLSSLWALVLVKRLTPNSKPPRDGGLSFNSLWGLYRRSNERLKIIETGTEDSYIEYVSFQNGAKNVRTFMPLQFLAEVSQHIPNIWEQTSRFMGAYSARTRGAANQLKKLALENGKPLLLPEPIQKPSANCLSPRSSLAKGEARLMKKVFEFDPPICPKCGHSRKIKAFITNASEIDRITKNLNIPNQRAPPKLPYTLHLAA